MVATTLTQAANGKQQISPMLHTLGHLPEELATVTQLLADAGYYSAANVDTCVAAGIAPFIAAVGRESHHLPWEARFTNPAPAFRRAKSSRKFVVAVERIMGLPGLSARP